MESSLNKSAVLDGLSIITAFLVAFAFSDMSQLDKTSFDHQVLFIFYSISLMFTITTGSVLLIAVAFIVIKLRRLIQRDTVRPIYWRSHFLENFKKNYKTASSARAWYYGVDANGDIKPGQSPSRIIKRSIHLFLIMMASYITSLFFKGLDTFYDLEADDNPAYLAIPIAWITISIFCFVMLLHWLHVQECIHDIA
mmetsp:Transcript_49002/g.78282  ORF Transcript_49002/g.78282 Transcript_49002/m.78282 type:complete len:196 (-) Transcript_49002:141-728(-)